MGKLIITYYQFRIVGSPPTVESFKCRSKERAEEIVRGRNNVKEWKYYETGEIIPRVTKKVEIKQQMSMEQMEKMIARL